jgi:hypothetical protein
MRRDWSAATTEAGSAWSPFRHVAFTVVAVVVGHGSSAAAWPLAAGAQQRPSRHLASRRLLCRSHSARSEAGRSPGAVSGEIRDGREPHDRQGARACGATVDNAARHRGGRIETTFWCAAVEVRNWPGHRSGHSLYLGSCGHAMGGAESTRMPIGPGSLTPSLSLASGRPRALCCAVFCDSDHCLRSIASSCWPQSFRRLRPR